MPRLTVVGVILDVLEPGISLLYLLPKHSFESTWPRPVSAPFLLLLLLRSVLPFPTFVIPVSAWVLLDL